mmetsp:Transcript_1331/g.2948  ORF Transcript_1331/g.2948 Transcript_1331/m.2948 type:complete len:517 (-) Transcript_1331:51-1601(-)
MNNSSSLTIQFQSLLSSGLYNFDSKRFRKASLEKRVEGWTETWGAAKNGDGRDDDNDDVSKQQSCWEQDTQDVGLLLATRHPQQYSVILTQFRVAWLEQVVLRIAKIPHVVVNSTYVCSEATGQLPYLQDSGYVPSSSSPSHNPSPPRPVLVGRHHPSNLIDHYSTDNHILKYLMDKSDSSSGRHIDLDSCLSSDHQRGLARCYLRMIQSDLDMALMYLRYEDRDCWNQVYRRQYLDAGSLVVEENNHMEQHNWFRRLQGGLQASMDRSVWRRRLIEYSTQVQSIQSVVERVKDCYQSLEAQLSSHTRPYLLGTDTPALVDAYLFAHLADAVGDVHLVVVLASFPRLVQFLQMMIETYFLDDVVERSDWAQWNRKQNETNAFQRIPIIKSAETDTASTAVKNPEYKDAVELMEALLLQKSDLNVILRTAKTKRDREPWPEPSKPTETTLYRWCMGEDIEMKKRKKNENDDDNDPSKALRKKLMRDQIRNDQVWMSGVFAASVIAILMMQGGNDTSA